MGRDLNAAGTSVDLDAVDAALCSYTAIMRETAVPSRTADAVAYRLADYVPALLAEVRRLRVGVEPSRDDASDYHLILEEIAGKLIGDGWDDDAAEVAIVIAWAEHMAAVHPDCPGRFCQAASGAPGSGVVGESPDEGIEVGGWRTASDETPIGPSGVEVGEDDGPGVDWYCGHAGCPGHLGESDDCGGDWVGQLLRRTARAWGPDIAAEVAASRIDKDALLAGPVSVAPRVDELGEHPWWCSAGHCTAGEPWGDHRSVPWVVSAPADRSGFACVEVSLWLDAYAEITDAAGIELRVSRMVGHAAAARVVSLQTFELTAAQVRCLAAGCLAVADLHDRHTGQSRALDAARGCGRAGRGVEHA